MKNLFRLSLSIVLATCLGACASSEVRPVNPKVAARTQAIDRAQLATMTIYRPANIVGSALRPTIVLDGKDLANIGNGKVFVAGLAPGHHIFEMDDKKSGSEVDLRPGENIYLKIEIVPGFWKGGGKLTQVAPQQGSYEAARLDLIDPKEIENPSYR